MLINIMEEIKDEKRTQKSIFDSYVHNCNHYYFSSNQA